uniref:Uncharacterized protein n=1 Tax=Arundo donax TaxID=35708 RepID=A0A0A9EFQ0_ARUDO
MAGSNLTANSLVAVDFQPRQRRVVLMVVAWVLALDTELPRSMEVLMLRFMACSRLVDLVAKVQLLLVFLACQLVQLHSLSHQSSRLHLWGLAWQDQTMTI